VTVHREQSVKKEYQQDATIQMFIVNFKCLLSTAVSTCFGHHYAHHQEKKDGALLHMVFALVMLDVAGCSCGALRPHPTTQRPTTATSHIQHYQRKHHIQ